jgi:phage-related baseplate assembly protein
MSMLNNLPDVDFTVKDTATIEADVIGHYEAATGKKLYPGDPVRLFLESVAYRIAQQRTLIDFAAKQNLLAYSSGDFLDHLGALVGTARNPAQPALTTVRFTLSAVQAGVVTIPKGSRVTPDGQLFFATTAAGTVPPGEMYVDVQAACQTAGTAGNGFVAGQIAVLVDPVPYVASAVNTTTTAGGADTESDDNYRLRISQAPEQFSVAGPYRAYEYWARTANQAIIDVSVYSPTPGVVQVRPLMVGGTLPTQDILDAVDAIVSADDIRPLTDNVEVLAPETVTYDITATYYLDADTASPAAVQATIDDAVAAFQLWQSGKLGRDINPSELVRRIRDAGAKRVTVTAPVDTPLEVWQVAQVGTVTVTYGGLE